MAFWVNKADRKQYNALFADVVKSLTNDVVDVTENDGEMKPYLVRFKEVLDYNMLYEKAAYGPYLIKVYKVFCNDEINEEEVYLANMLGWCIELVNTCTIILDNITDRAETRRGKLCWHQKEGVGLNAINDAFSLQASAYNLLRKYFQHKPYYRSIVKLFQELITLHIAGQSLDVMSGVIGGKIELEKFTLDRFYAIAKYKNAFSNFYVVICSALYMAGISDPKVQDTAKQIFFELGILIQVENDYDDCFGDLSITGKNKLGTDIEEGKCTWLVATALRLGNPDDVAVILRNYGRNEPKSVAKVMAVYEKLEIAASVKKYQEEKYKAMIKLINQLESKIPTNIIHELLEIICKTQAIPT